MGILLRKMAAQFHQPLCKFAVIQAAAGWRTGRGRTRSGRGRVETGRGQGETRQLRIESRRVLVPSVSPAEVHGKVSGVGWPSPAGSLPTRHACVYIYIHVCLYVCMHVYMYICVYVWLFRFPPGACPLVRPRSWALKNAL